MRSYQIEIGLIWLGTITKAEDQNDSFFMNFRKQIHFSHPSRMDVNPPSGLPVASLGHNERQLADKSPSEIKSKERGQRAFSLQKED